MIRAPSGLPWSDFKSFGSIGILVKAADFVDFFPIWLTGLRALCEGFLMIGGTYYFKY